MVSVLGNSSWSYSGALMALLLLVVSAWFWAGESAPHGERASATSRGVFPPCPNELVIQHERLFKRLLKAVFTTQGVLLEGSIIDAGANDGSESCHFAEWQPQRLVHAIEPLLENLKHIRKFGKHRPNLRPFHGGLGNTSTWVRAVAPGGSGVTAQVSLLSSKPKARAADSLQSEEHASSFFIHRVDDLFANRWSRERLAFAHWDVEGLELAVVHGAWHTLRLHRPVITVEMFVNRALKQGQQLLRLIAEAVYDCFLVEEPCGLPLDCRNVICVPTERTVSFLKLPVVQDAERAHQITSVHSSSLARHGYPVCVKAAPCCPKNVFGSCCFPACVSKWLLAQPIKIQQRYAQTPTTSLLREWKAEWAAWPNASAVGYERKRSG